MTKQSDILPKYLDIIDAIAAEKITWSGYSLKDTDPGRKILAFSIEEMRGFVFAALEWLNQKKAIRRYETTYMVKMAALAVLKKNLGFSLEQVSELMESLFGDLREPKSAMRVVENYAKANELTPELRQSLARWMKDIGPNPHSPDYQGIYSRIQTLLGDTEAPEILLVPGEAWADQTIADIHDMRAEDRLLWVNLINQCGKATGSSPSDKWMIQAWELVEKIGTDAFKASLMRWFPLVDKPRTAHIDRWSEYVPDPNHLIIPLHADILRGLVWLCSLEEDAEMARAVKTLAFSAYRKLAKLGPRCTKVGNACIWTLGHMHGLEGVSQLALLKVRLKMGSQQKMIDQAFDEAARRAGLSAEEIEEIAVPTYGMQEVGLRRETLGDFTVEVRVTGTTEVELQWFRPDGKPQASVPQQVKTDFAEDYKEIIQAAKDIQKMVPAQRDRIDNLFLEQKVWTLPIWRERYSDHPLVGTLARRLIWKFTRGDRAAAGIWHEGQIVGRDGQVLDWLDDQTKVELWHPLQVATDVVLEWRKWLAEHEIQQPFKQAHREVYILTDAEVNTGVYSNRYAAHIIKQHQFNALCGVRGWKNKLRLMVDDTVPAPSRDLPKWGLRAEFWVDSIGENYGTDTNDSGVYLYLSTDQVRFYKTGAPQHLAHACGGGYHTYGQSTEPANQPLPLDQIHPLVLSEIMRDVDLFVGVASVANDPAWSDGGPDGRYQNYWHSYSFGELSATAQTRRQALEGLLPRLKIASRCSLQERFLVVQGDLRTYKIHLGSGNILMEPNDQYLCIVPARSQDVVKKVHLPFEGDAILSVILSKAMMLAEDKKISDPTITSQINRK